MYCAYSKGWLVRLSMLGSACRLKQTSENIIAKTYREQEWDKTLAQDNYILGLLIFTVCKGAFCQTVTDIRINSESKKSLIVFATGDERKTESHFDVFKWWLIWK